MIYPDMGYIWIYGGFLQWWLPLNPPFTDGMLRSASPGSGKRFGGGRKVIMPDPWDPWPMMGISFDSMEQWRYSGEIIGIYHWDISLGFK